MPLTGWMPGPYWAQSPFMIGLARPRLSAISTSQSEIEENSNDLMVYFGSNIAFSGLEHKLAMHTAFGHTSFRRRCSG